jgi:aarF domain-containing kinase
MIAPSLTRLISGNNQIFGSPVNRIKITGTWASRSLITTPNLTFIQRLKEYYRYFIFGMMMFSIDLAFWAARLKQWWRGKDKGGFEDELERSVRTFAKSNFGVEITEGAIYTG